jgi:hypothetical protein
VTTGSYSDYSVEAIFASRDLAEAHAVGLREHNDVQQLELLDHAPTRFTVYAISNDTYHARDEAYEWTYTAWEYNADLYEPATVTKYGRGSVRVCGTDQEAVRAAYREATS